MATFTGTAGVDIADVSSATLTGFTGGSLADLQDSVGDRFRGFEAGDTVRAGEGDDAIFGGLGDDVLDGNGGADTFNYESDAEIGADRIDGGQGEDTIRLAFTGDADFRGATIASSVGTSIEVLILEGAGHKVLFNGDQAGGMEAGLAANLMIVGDDSGRDDVIFLDASSLDLSAFQFDFWNPNLDLISLFAAAAGSTLRGSSMRDEFRGDVGVDVLRGEAGDDMFAYFNNGAIAGDTIDGGGGSDALRVAFNGLVDFRGATIASTGTSSIEDLSLFGAAHDVRFNASQVSATGLAANLAIEGQFSSGADVITFGNAVNLDLFGFQFSNWDEATDRIVINGSGDDGALTGTKVADTIDGGGGADVIKGGLGVDLVKGGAGNDVLLYTANDEIGAETIDGGADSDTLRVNFTGLADFRNATIASTGTASIERLELIGNGHDVTFNASQVGGAGLVANLMIVGDDSGSDLVRFTDASSLDLSTFQFDFWAESDTDVIVIAAAAAGSTVTGTSKRDSFTGGAGVDVAIGGGGGDIFLGSAGADVLRGETAGDTFTYSSNADIVGDTIDGGAGLLDELQVSFTGLADFTGAIIASTGAVSIEFLSLFGAGHDVRFNASQVGATGLAANLTIQGDNSGADIVTFNNAAALDLSTFQFSNWNQAIDRIILNATASGSGLTGSSVADTLNGGAGIDFLAGGPGDDLLDGGGGPDSVDYSGVAAGVTVFLAGVSDGFALVTGSAEHDTIRNIESIFSGAGKDALVGNASDNLLIGGADNDFLFSNGFNADGTLKAGAGKDQLDGNDGDDGLFAGDGADRLNGGTGNDGLVGGGGADILSGEQGNDFLFGGAFSPAGARLDGSGDDSLNGDEGNDGLYGFDGVDSIVGGDGNDYVEGGAGVDAINGGADSDFLLGGADGDTITGGTGFDFLFGEAGADTFIFRKGDSADWILDFSAAQGDKLRFLDFGFANFAAIPLVDLSTPGHPAVQLTFIEGGNVDQLTIFGVTLAQLNATNVLVV